MKRSADEAGLSSSREEIQREEEAIRMNEMDDEWNRLYIGMARAYMDRFDEFPMMAAAAVVKHEGGEGGGKAS